MLSLVDEPVRLALQSMLDISGTGVHLVGGFVRDMFLGQNPKDQDFLVTGLAPERLIGILSEYGHTDVAGKSFGVVKFRPVGCSTVYDFALPRRERQVGTRRADFLVDVDPFMPLEEDLLRRDFTMGAMALDVVTGHLVDPYGGRADIENKVIRTVTKKSFAEDATRMLRAVQFATRFNMRLDPALCASMRSNAHRITCEPGERIATELAKLLTAEYPSGGFALLRSHGLLKLILPELDCLSGMPQPRKYHKYDVLGHSLVSCDRIPVGSSKAKNKSKLVTMRLAALLHDTGKAVTLKWKEDHTPTYPGHDEEGAKINKVLLSRLKFSTVEAYKIDTDLVERLARHHMFDCDETSAPRVLRRFVNRVSRVRLIPQIRLRIADRLAKGFHEDVSQWVSFAKRLRTVCHGVKAAYDRKFMAVNGNDVMNHLAIGPGKAVGLILDGLFEAVMDEPALNTKEALLDLAGKIKEKL